MFPVRSITQSSKPAGADVATTHRVGAVRGVATATKKELLIHA